MLESPSPLTQNEFDDTTQFLFGLLKVENQLPVDQFDQALNEHYGFNKLLTNLDDIKKLITLLFKQTFQVHPTVNKELLQTVKTHKYRGDEFLFKQINALSYFNYLLKVLHAYVDNEHIFTCYHTVLIQLSMLKNLSKAVVLCDKLEQMKAYEFGQDGHPMPLDLKRIFLQQANELHNSCAPYLHNLLHKKDEKYNEVELAFKRHLTKFMISKLQLHHRFCVLSYQVHDMNCFEENVAQFNVSKNISIKYFSTNIGNYPPNSFEIFNAMCTQYASRVHELKKLIKQRNPAVVLAINSMKEILKEVNLNDGIIDMLLTTNQIVQYIVTLEQFSRQNSISSYFYFFKNHILLVKAIYYSTKMNLPRHLAAATLLQSWSSILHTLNFVSFSSFNILKKYLSMIKYQLYTKVKDHFPNHQMFENATTNSFTLCKRLEIEANSALNQAIENLDISMQQLSLAPKSYSDYIEVFKNHPIEIFHAIYFPQEWSYDKQQAVVNCAQYLPTLDFNVFLKELTTLFANQNAVANLHCCYNLEIIPYIALGLGADWFKYFHVSSLVYGFVQHRLSSTIGMQNGYSILALFLIANIEKEYALAFTSSHDAQQEIDIIERVINQFLSLYQGNIDNNNISEIIFKLKNILTYDLWPNYKETCIQAHQMYTQQQNFTPLYNTNGNAQNQNANNAYETNQIEKSQKSVSKSRRQGY